MAGRVLWLADSMGENVLNLKSSRTGVVGLVLGNFKKSCGSQGGGKWEQTGNKASIGRIEGLQSYFHM